MNVIRFSVIGEALSKGSMRAFMPKGAKYPVVTSTTKGLKQWEQTIRAAAQTVATGKLMAGALQLRVTFWFMRPKSLPKRITFHTRRPDVDKASRAVCDSLTKVLWADDSQIVALIAEKKYTTSELDAPHVDIEVTNLEPGLFEAAEEPLGDGEIRFDY